MRNALRFRRALEAANSGDSWQDRVVFVFAFGTVGFGFIVLVFLMHMPEIVEDLAGSFPTWRLWLGELDVHAFTPKISDVLAYGLLAWTCRWLYLAHRIWRRGIKPSRSMAQAATGLECVVLLLSLLVVDRFIEGFNLLGDFAGSLRPHVLYCAADHLWSMTPAIGLAVIAGVAWLILLKKTRCRHSKRWLHLAMLATTHLCLAILLVLIAL